MSCADVPASAVSTGIRSVAVGTMVTRRPPHRSVLAELLHTAPASDSTAITLRRIGVLLSAARNIAVNQALESRPSHSMSLAATTQALQPCPAYLLSKALEPTQLVRHRVVIEIALYEIALYHALEPVAYLRHRFVPFAPEFNSNGRQCSAHPLLHRQPQYFETSLARPRFNNRAHVRRSGLLWVWSQSPSPAVVCGAGVATTFDLNLAFGASTP